MKQLPNLLKQESSAAATLVNVLLKMYNDPREAHRATRKSVVERLVPSVDSYLSPFRFCSDEICRLAKEIIGDFNLLDLESQPRNVAAWTPVISDILKGCCILEIESVSFAR